MTSDAARRQELAIAGHRLDRVSTNLAGGERKYVLQNDIPQADDYYSSVFSCAFQNTSVVILQVRCTCFHEKGGEDNFKLENIFVPRS